MADRPYPNGVTLCARGKINLTLAVTGRRADGYHTLSGVMQSIALSNRLTLRIAGAGVSLLCDDPALPCDRRNTAVRAGEAFLARIGSTAGLSVTLEKRIPYQAGLGSASADAAGVLSGANLVFGSPLSREELLSLAGSVGADVPFCLIGGTHLAEGIGELLTPLPPMPVCTLLLAKPPEGISTPAAYARIDALSLPFFPDPALPDALRRGSLSDLAKACVNVFEKVCPVGVVATLRGAMVECGALGGAMSGSGTAVYGIFTGDAEARDAMRRLSVRFPTCRFFLTHPEKCGISVE